MADFSSHNIKVRPYTRLMMWYRENDLYIPGFNTLARAALAIRLRREERTVATWMVGKEQEFEEWKATTPLFFGFGSFRSGTVFLANMLKTELPNSHIEHEANVLDHYHYSKAIQSEEEALHYLKYHRQQELYWRCGGKQVDRYGEINPFLRLHATAVKKTFPKAKLFHVVRDGRNIVRSIYSREILGKSDPLNKLIYPPKGDPYFEKWSTMSRFEKICWQWQYDNAYLLKVIGKPIKFELLRSDYDYFKSELLDQIGVDIDALTWQGYVSQKQNVTPTYRLPHYKDWTATQQQQFKSICGEVMQRCGYEL